MIAPFNRLSVAPMMDWTDRHCRYFHRLLAPHARLYTEMVTTGALIHGDRGRHLDFDAAEHPLALQLGGSEPEDLGACAALAADWGYDEVNINCGCPSDRVQKGRFGACLMDEPELVASSVRAMRDRFPGPVTVKTRLGIDDRDDDAYFDRFCDAVIAAGSAVMVIHARKAWLSGLSPRENREIPPLRYDRVRRLKSRHPSVPVILNGGLISWEQIAAELPHVDGVMIGRAAYQDPWMLAMADARLAGAPGPRSRAENLRAMLPYVESARRRGVPLNSITRHMLGLCNGLRGGRRYRQILSTDVHAPGAGPEVLERAIAAVDDPRLNERPL